MTWADRCGGCHICQADVYSRACLIVVCVSYLPHLFAPAISAAVLLPHRVGTASLVAGAEARTTEAAAGAACWGFGKAFG